MAPAGAIVEQKREHENERPTASSVRELVLVPTRVPRPFPRVPDPFPFLLALDFARKAPFLECDFVDEGEAHRQDEAVQVPGRVELGEEGTESCGREERGGGDGCNWFK